MFLILKPYSMTMSTNIGHFCMASQTLMTPMLGILSFLSEGTIISTIILPPKVEVMAPILVVPASLLPEWTILSTIILPPNMEVMAPVLVVPTCMPEWTIVLKMILPPNAEVLVLVLLGLATFMPIISMVLPFANMEIMWLLLAVPTYMQLLDKLALVRGLSVLVCPRSTALFDALHLGSLLRGSLPSISRLPLIMAW
jgi:hypothetical protein